jgi:beta-N-acetylhexosaminidase
VALSTRRFFPIAIAIAVATGLLGACTIPEAPTALEPETVVLDTAPTVPAETPPSPVPTPEEALEEQLATTVASLELRQKVSGLLIATVPGTDASAFRELLDTVPVAGFLLSRSNVQGTPEDTAAYLSMVQGGQDYPLLMSVDQEGSPIARLLADDFPGAQDLGQGPVEDTTTAFQARQELVAQSGATVNFGVVGDVTPGSGAYIHPRSFGADPAIVSDHVVAALEARAPGVAQTLKHFPGHGLVQEDSHLEIPETTIGYDLWWDTHALPFRAGVEEGVDLVMMAHIRVLSVSKDPASVSNDWIDILRNDLGYDGVIITDDLAMLKSSGEEAYHDPAATAVAALVAGNDLIMLALDLGEVSILDTYNAIADALVAAVVEGRVSEAQVDESLTRVLRLRASLVR